MKFHFAFLLFLASLTAAAQYSYGPTNDSLYLGFKRDSIDAIEKPTLLLIPFHPDKYMSEVDRDIAKGTTYTYQHTRGFFRKGLDNAILIASKEYNHCVNLHADDPKMNMDLDFVYHLTQPFIVPYEPPVIKEDQGFKKRLAEYWLKLQGEVANEPEPGTRIEQGQIVSVADHRELITKVRVLNSKLTDSLSAKYDVDYYVFVNELDMLITSTDYRELQSDDYGRIIKAHISVLDRDGNELFSLIKKEPFSSRENDLENVIRYHYLPLGHEIVFALDSYRFLKAGMKPIVEEEEKKSLGKNIRELAPLQKLKSHD